ncbi:MAG TPA: VWA domain-containing protein [Bryobacteraceae bacterium]|jgi:VWFA-related protein
MMTSEKSADAAEMGQAIGLCRLSSTGSDRPQKAMACPTLLAMFAVLAAAGAFAQQQPSPAPTVKFQSTTQLVVETVTVKDKNGNPIEGLTAKDFVVTEDGQPQTIRFCEFQKLDNTPAPAPPPATVAQLTEPKAAPAVTSTPIAPETPGDIRYRDRRLLALYFDMSAMPVADQLRALQAAQKFLSTGVTTADLVALMEYEGGAVKVLQDFTSDRELLEQTIQKLIIGEGEGFEEADEDDMASDTFSAFGQDDSEFNIFNTDRQLSAIQTAAKMLGGLNEKKALIYFASGMRLNGVDNQAQLRATTNAAIRANVALFTIDARGLVAQAPMGDATHGSVGGLSMYNGAGAMASTQSLESSQDTMYTLASDTGGKALLDVNDLGRGIVAAQEALSSYYIIGYYTTNSALDGKFRRVNISLKEITSAKLDYRRGYFGGKEFAKFTAADKERQLEEALMLGDPITDLTIALEVNYFQLNHAEYYVPVVMKIPGSELALARRGGAERTLIDFIGEIKDEYGTTIQNIRDKVDIKLSGETAAELVKRPIEYDTGYTLLPGIYTIKVLARDDETGRIGTYMTKFTIPNLNKEVRSIPISSVVLSSQRVDLRDALYTAGKDKLQVMNPLVLDGQKLIPSVTRVFSTSREMYVYLQAYESTATAEPVVAFVTFYRGRAKVFETPPMQVSELLESRLKTLPLKFSLSLAKLPPGRYNCQISVLDPAAQKAAFWQAPIMLVP